MKNKLKALWQYISRPFNNKKRINVFAIQVRMHIKSKKIIKGAVKKYENK